MEPGSHGAGWGDRGMAEEGTGTQSGFGEKGDAPGVPRSLLPQPWGAVGADSPVRPAASPAIRGWVKALPLGVRNCSGQPKQHQRWVLTLWGGGCSRRPELLGAVGMVLPEPVSPVVIPASQRFGGSVASHHRASPKKRRRGKVAARRW